MGTVLNSSKHAYEFDLKLGLCRLLPRGPAACLQGEPQTFPLCGG
jgi:hypothetical protein